MKKTILFTALMLCFAGTANAQFFKKLGKKAEQAAEKAIERKVERKATKETEKAFDSTFNKKRKNKKQTKSGNGMSGLTQVDPAESYAFTNKAEMHIISGKEEANFDYYLPKSDEFFGMTIKDERVQDDFFMVYDASREAMFTFMKNNGQKIRIGISFKPDDTDDVDVPVFDIKATGNSKTILGYNCLEYKMISEDITATVWVTKDVDIRFPSTFHSVKKKKSTNQEWMKKLDGWAMEMTMIDSSRKKPHTIIMKCLSIEASDMKINSNDYKSLGY